MTNRTVQLVCIVGLLLCVGGAALLVPRIESQRRELELEVPSEFGREQMPIMVLLNSAGALRGVVTNFMWHRADQMKQEGKYYEANQLAQLICELQPRNAAAWRFQSWNMAYNISVTTHTPEERWYWVNAGIKLLREKGIPLNPKGSGLFQELSWTFYHKIGQYSDDMHWYYKRKLAHEWQEVLGVPVQGATTEQVVDAFRLVADAPDTLGELVEEDPRLKPLLDRLGAIGSEPGTPLLREVGRVFMYNYLVGDSLVGQGVRSRPEHYRDALVSVLRDEELGAALPVLLAFMRKQTLRNDYHMDPEVMLGLMELYGPLDWRHSAAHGVYWGELAFKVNEKRRSRRDFDVVNTNRQVVHGLQQLFQAGAISYFPDEQYIDQLPDPRFVPAYEKAWEIAIERVKQDDKLKGLRVIDNYAAGHENFLLNAVVTSYLYGSEEQAGRLYKRVRELYGTAPHNLATGRYLKPLPELVFSELQETIDLVEMARGFADAMITQSLVRGLANGRMDVYERFLALAERGHAEFQKKSTATPIAERDRMSMLPFNQMLTETYTRKLQLPQWPIMNRARIWASTPLPLRQRTYDRLRDQLAQECQAEGLSFASAFPEPTGMEAFRKERAEQPQSPTPGTIQRQ